MLVNMHGMNNIKYCEFGSPRITKDLQMFVCEMDSQHGKLLLHIEL
jgi:hypothetical protein